jgi:hypothetical protein
MKQSINYSFLFILFLLLIGCSSIDPKVTSIDVDNTNHDLSSTYANETLYLIPSNDWKDVFVTIPKLIYTKDSNIHIAPVVIFQKDDLGYDLDSVFHFINQFKPKKVVIIDEFNPSIKAILENNEVTTHNFKISFAEEVPKKSNIQVYVEDKYDISLFGSSYASLINADLIIDNHNLNNLESKAICIGDVSQKDKCNIKFNLFEVQKDYLKKTSTDKLILTSDNFENDYDFEGLEYEMPYSKSKTDSIYSHMSLVAPLISAAKHELIIFSNETEFELVDKLIDKKIEELKFNPKFLTIVASPKEIDIHYNRNKVRGIPMNLAVNGGNYGSADYVYYSTDKNFKSSRFTGRIYGITVTDASLLIMRTLFYDQIKKNNSIFLSSGDHSGNSPAMVEGTSILLKSLGYEDVEYEYENFNDRNQKVGKLLEDRKLIIMNGHGTEESSGISTDNIPWLDNSFVASSSCSTCRWSHSLNSFCMNFIRKGAVGYIGGVSERPATSNLYILSPLISYDSTLGTLLYNTLGIPHFSVLIGDPTFKLPLEKRLPTAKLTQNKDNNFTLSIPIIKIDTISQEALNLAEDDITKQGMIYYHALMSRNVLFSGGGKGFRIKVKKPAHFDEFVATNMLDINFKEDSIDDSWVWIKINRFYDDFFYIVPELHFQYYDTDITFLKKAPDFEPRLYLTPENLILEINNTGNLDSEITGDFEIQSVGNYETCKKSYQGHIDNFLKVEDSIKIIFNYHEFGPDCSYDKLSNREFKDFWFRLIDRTHIQQNYENDFFILE